ncbi:palmitoleoyl-protein carboxylesterase notum1a-like isoform X2 [Tigriopus californicus]|nr:palmitoleoyl-protein carboxylesterase notum1a-like isoform X2 [Tigriopus californicus]|eukprot:TCALIF_07997-PA protein Name:"Similar to Notum Protein notum homolog (Mus musculus)" AED:0.06 eAED:0.06 QI:1/1/0.6/1/1/1/5/419/730
MILPKMKFFLVVVLLVVCTGCTILAQQSPESQDGNLSSESDHQGLTPDTFRKLAEALYQRGEKVQNRLKRNWLTNTNVTCNDGSPSGYYLRRNYQSKRWIVFLEGGWICFDRESCMQRASREPHLVSSSHWRAIKSVGGILSSDPEDNPHFANANHVYVPYCSSDSWSGTKTGSKRSPAFMGHLIVKEVIRELSDYHQLLHGEELFLMGSSAGGTGVLLNIDSVSQTLAPAGIRVRGIVDSGWFLDNDPFSTDCQASSGKCSVIRDLQKGVKMWNANVQRDCSKAFKGEEYKCFLGYMVYPFIQTPLFIFQWQFDKFQLHANNVDIPASQDQWKYIHQMGENLRSSLGTVNAVFSPACIAHEILTKGEWKNITVNSVTLPNAIKCWSESLPKDKPMFAQAEEGVQVLKAYAQVKEDYFQAQHERGNNYMYQATQMLSRGSSAMMADATHLPYKLAGNLVRSLPYSRENSRNSLRNNNHRVRHTNPKIYDNRTNGGGERSRSRMTRRERRKCRKHPEKCHYQISNGYLIRSLDRRSNRKEKQGKEKKKLTKEERSKRRERRMRRREQKKARKAERRRLKRQRRQERLARRKTRQLQRNAKRSSESTTPRSSRSYDEERDALLEAQQHHLKVRSVRSTPSPDSHTPSPSNSEEDQSFCALRLVETCSFPHCNPTCPVLLSSDSGQEIDLLTLFQSFGLDIAGMAKALNVGMSDLQDMDREDIISLLALRSQN